MTPHFSARWIVPTSVSLCLFFAGCHEEPAPTPPYKLLEEELRSDDPQKVELACIKLRDEQAAYAYRTIDTLVDVIRRNSNEEAAALCSTVVTKIGPSIADKIIPLLNETDVRTVDRFMLVAAYVGYARPDVLAKLQGFLKHPSPKLRVDAVGAIGRCAMQGGSARQSWPLLVDVADHDPDYDTRAAAIETLGEWRVREALPVLKRSLSSKEKGLRFLAREAIQRIGG